MKMNIKNLTPAQIIRKSLKLGLRGGATLFVPIFTFYFFKDIPIMEGLALQCGILIPALWVAWIQSILAWVDDSLRWFGK